MLGAVLHAPRDVRVEKRDEPRLVEPTEAAAGYAAMDERRAIKALLRP